MDSLVRCESLHREAYHDRMSAAPVPAVDTKPRIQAKPGARYPDGPSTFRRIVSGKMLRQAKIADLRENARQYGDLVHIRATEGHAWQFNHPELIQELVVNRERQNRRVLTMQKARTVLGDGLLTSEEPLHMRQRRLVAPAFHRQRIAGYGEVIGQVAEQIEGAWQPGERDVHPDMLVLALRVTGKCLFDIDSEPEIRRLARTVQVFLGPPPPVWVPASLLEVLRKLPIPPVRRVQEALGEFDRSLYAMIADRRRNPGDRGDLLSMLLASEDGERMTDKQVRDECFTIMLAGHETTANALSFTLWLLAKHPEIQERARAEAVAVLGGRTPGAEDYPKLPYLYAVFAESMRLLPTVWVFGRACGPEPYQVGGFTIRPGDTLIAPQIVVHRDPRWWANPDRFDPGHFLPEKPGDAKSTRPRFAYFPFGGGSRQCIGESLAWMEGVLSLAAILRGWRLRPPPGAPEELPILESINLRPKQGVRLVLERC